MADNPIYPLEPFGKEYGSGGYTTMEYRVCPKCYNKESLWKMNVKWKPAGIHQTMGSSPFWRFETEHLKVRCYVCEFSWAEGPADSPVPIVPPEPTKDERYAAEARQAVDELLDPAKPYRDLTGAK